MYHLKQTLKYLNLLQHLRQLEKGDNLKVRRFRQRDTEFKRCNHQKSPSRKSTPQKES